MKVVRDITDNRFGRLLVKSPTKDESGRKVWECLCDCGRTCYRTYSALNKGQAKSCGCLQKEAAKRNGQAQIKNITGTKIGDVKVLAVAPYRSGAAKRIAYICRCEQQDCGYLFVREGAAVRANKVVGCGRHHKIYKGADRKHPLYGLWGQMIRRCHGEISNDHRYVNKGIKVCERWRNAETGFPNFVKDMGVRPSKKHSIDRIDNNEGYFPDNCRWADNKTQTRNTTRDSGKYSKYRGVSWHLQRQRWCANCCGKHVIITDSEITAAKAFDAYARSIGYEEAWLNFPEEG